MPLDIVLFTIGQIETNTYLTADRATGKAVLIDPAEESSLAVREARERGWDLTAIWLTHAHFDHFAGAGEAERAWGKPLPVGVHPADLPLWKAKGDAPRFGIDIDPGPEPTLFFEPGKDLPLGESAVSVLFVPGHTPGHVVLYSAADKTAFCGDVIFAGSIGRTDLPGADFDLLVAGIRREILTLPDDTRLLPGHGPATTVGAERKYNPFIGRKS
jgi:glyoxylase-like metal-dependent hydrolase (beta-lactamase superfamily II)